MQVSPQAVWPLSTGRPKQDYESSVILTLKEPAPAEGCTVNLAVEPPMNEKDSGGHKHDGGRPVGTLSSNGIVEDKVKFNVGEMGVKSVKYTSTEVSGVERIKAWLEGSSKTTEMKIDVRVPGLVALSDGEGYVLIGQTSTHPENHYGTTSTLSALAQLAMRYFYEKQGTLRINDMSLMSGGAFDFCGQWDPSKTCARYPNGGHLSHRMGKNIDVDDLTAEEKVVTERLLEKTIVDLRLQIKILPEGNHFHLTFL